MSKNKKRRYEKELQAAEEFAEKKMSTYFSNRLRTRDHWRLYREFQDTACFLDIETTGLGFSNEITVVGIYNGKSVKSFVRGMNLSEENLKRELSKHGLVLTFYGSCFDLPFILNKFSGISLEIPHIDLCFTSRRAGFKGGLKAIERDLGIAREGDIVDVDGFEAVRLWRDWERYGNKEALERLLEYNKADVLNLKHLADTVYGRLREKTFESICG